MKVHGACHCRGITYEAEADPRHVYVCNCTDCQVLTGSAFRVSVPSTGFRLLTGRPATYVKIADSGTRRRHAFCPTCGSPIYACADSDDPPGHTLRVGGLDEKRELAPVGQGWCASALPWAKDVPALPGREGQ